MTTPALDEGFHAEVAPHTINRPLVTQVWRDVTMLHWREDPAVGRALLPPGLEPDVADGSAWVSLVPAALARPARRQEPGRHPHRLAGGP